MPSTTQQFRDLEKLITLIIAYVFIICIWEIDRNTDNKIDVWNIILSFMNCIFNLFKHVWFQAFLLTLNRYDLSTEALGFD